MEKAVALAELNRAGLTALAQHLDELARPATRLHAQAADEATLALGVSKLGGLPDLPANAEWPQGKGASLAFVAQIRLEEIHALDIEQALPPAGLLSFFYDARQQTFGGDPADRDGWRVYVFDGDTGPLQRRAAPADLPSDARYSACALSFTGDWTLPEQPQLDLPSLAWSDDDQQRYDSVLASLRGTETISAPRHQLLGHPESLQDDMRAECQLAAGGVNVAQADGDARTPELLKGALRWRLLLQVDSDERAGMRWADAGMLYFWIPQESLSARQFEDVWVVLQSD